MVDNETLQVIKRRRSVRSFLPEQIKDEELQAVLEAGLYAPNAGDQAWHFTAVQNKELLTRLNLAAKEAARQSDVPWLRQLGNDAQFDCLYGAPTLILVSGSQQSPVPLEADCAAATQTLLLAAESIGLGSCWIYFVTQAFSSSQGAVLREELAIPQGFKPFYGAVLGYKKGEPVSAPARKPNLITHIK